MSRRALLVSSLFVSGCFVELGGGYYPSVKQTITDVAGSAMTSSQPAWSASLQIGFFFDAVFEKLGFALGWAPKGADLVIAKDPQRAHGGDGHMFRGDLVLPPSVLGTDFLRTRVVGEFDYYTGASVRRPGETSYTDHGTGGGHRFFLGMGVGHTEEFGSVIATCGFDRNVLDTPLYVPPDTGSGLTSDPAVSTSAWGGRASITIVLVPEVGSRTSGIPDDPTPTSHGMIQTSPGACGPKTCDEHGNCKQECPHGVSP